MNSLRCRCNSMLPILAAVLLSGFCVPGARAASPATPPAESSASAPTPLAQVLEPDRWHDVESSVDRALAWMASRQAEDGSFPTIPAGQPAVTSLGILAFLSRGHQPGLGPYGAQIERAIDFVISCQKPDGLFSYESPGATHVDNMPSHTAIYNHAIAGLMLGEVYGHVTGKRAKNVRDAIDRALQFTRELQTRPKSFPMDKGGWRYLRLRYDHTAYDSDLSVTAWQLMFLRSARNAEFSVPQNYVDEGIQFVQRCFDKRLGDFNYALDANGAGVGGSRGLTGAGILSLSMAGQHHSPAALAAGDWLLAHPFRRFGDRVGTYDHFFYSTYYCSQAAAQLGGRYWAGVYPAIVESLLPAQRADGSWPLEIGEQDEMFGAVYPTAMTVLSLTPPYQLLPIYQR